MNIPDLTTAEWLPLEHDFDTGIVQFGKVTPADYGLHQDYVRKKVIAGTTETVDVHYDDIPVIPYEKTLYITHLGYGGSTLLSRLMDVPGKFLSNVEPILHCRGERFKDEVPNLSRLYSRNFDNEVNVIKTIPLEINWLESYMSRHKDNVCVLMHQTLDEFLIACFNQDSDRTKKALMNVCMWMGINDPIDHTNHELAVRSFIDYWTSTMSKYKEYIEREPSNVIGLRSSDFFNDPVGVAAMLSSYMDLRLTGVEHERAHRKLTKHSKWGSDFNEQDRIKQKQDAYNAVKPYLEKYKNEIDSLNKQYAFPESWLVKVS